jgi:hypothetical protein
MLDMDLNIVHYNFIQKNHRLYKLKQLIKKSNLIQITLLKFKIQNKRMLLINEYLIKYNSNINIYYIISLFA